MPDLNTTIHLSMLRDARHEHGLIARCKRALRTLVDRRPVYGMEWGDPDTMPPLQYVRDVFLLPYITPDTVSLEIGPGGGRWTRYLAKGRHVYAVDYHQELLDELARTLRRPDITPIKNHGDDFPGIPAGSVDFAFSFGVFVHLDLDIIDRYLGNLRPLLKPTGCAVIQYADRNKPLARNPGFSPNDPERMRAMARAHGYAILEEDTVTLWHSAIIRLGPGSAAA
jgi:SAM-dependent methyltransferase